MAKKKPEILTLPPMHYIAVQWSGDPNVEGGEYQRAMEILFPLAYTLKMSYKSDYHI
ncbi:hypothetical protein [Eubacterium aggregans]|uniref:hypothetical protein n=1 Tax=Eubacterium aggregans TaxID=81409 RepID=UPI003F326116